MKKRIVCALLFAATHGVAVVALGQTSEAERIFERARQEYEQGDLDAACPHLEKSFNMDGNGGALLSLARCLDDAGKTASAMARYEQFLKMIPTLDDKRREKAEGLRPDVLTALDALKDRVPRLALQLPPNAPTNLVIWLGGVQVPAATAGEVRLLDPGTYTLAADVPGRKREEWVVLLKEGVRLEEPIRIPEKVAGAPSPPAPVHVPKASGTARVVHPQSGRNPVDAIGTPKPRESGRNVGLAVGLTTAGIGFGAAAGMFGYALLKKPSIDAHCPHKVCDTPEWTTTTYRAQTLAKVTSIGVSVGIVGVAIAIVSFAVARKSNMVESRVGASVWRVDSTEVFGLKGAF